MKKRGERKIICEEEPKKDENHLLEQYQPKV
jgi:hypothetical protein